MDPGKPEKDNYSNKTPDVSDHLANERTFLAWLRTSIGIMAFGFVVVKFSLFMKEISTVLGKQLETNQKGFSSVLGIALVCVGLLTALFSYLKFKHTEKQLDNCNYKSSSTLITILVSSILLVSILLVVYLIRSI
jgi:putative membrane protein